MLAHSAYWAVARVGIVQSVTLPLAPAVWAAAAAAAAVFWIVGVVVEAGPGPVIVVVHRAGIVDFPVGNEGPAAAASSRGLIPVGADGSA